VELRTGRDRTVIVGDVHGCRRELEWLLELVRFGTGDRLVFVGDLVARGPDSLGVLALGGVLADVGDPSSSEYARLVLRLTK